MEDAIVRFGSISIGMVVGVHSLAGTIQNHADHFFFTDLLNSLPDSMLRRQLGADNEDDLSHKIGQYSRFGRQ